MKKKINDIIGLTKFPDIAPFVLIGLGWSNLNNFKSSALIFLIISYIVLTIFLTIGYILRIKERLKKKKIELAERERREREWQFRYIKKQKNKIEEDDDSQFEYGFEE